VLQCTIYIFDREYKCIFGFSIKCAVLHYVWLCGIIVYFNNTIECLYLMNIFFILMDSLTFIHFAYCAFLNTCVPHVHFTSINKKGTKRKLGFSKTIY
jgi:hypothetical protein